mmetsp:Transcript_46880/g.34319  ORF Transcript_46880/g.34319 Transcript_46880/m.34319 type:complete len:83 (-) Transcript_46880:495-743(-)
MLTKCVFQVIGESLRQFTLFEEDVQVLTCADQVFMKKAHKINLNESYFADKKEHKKQFNRNLSVPVGQSKIGFPHSQYVSTN